MISPYQYKFQYLLDSLDSDVQAFLSFTAITDITIIESLQTFVLSVKSAGLWSKIIALYPFLGNTSFQQSANLKDLSNQLNFTTGFVFDSLGCKSNGVGYADTNFLLSDYLTDPDSMSFGFFNNYHLHSSLGVDCGTVASTNHNCKIACRWVDHYISINCGNSITAPNVLDSKGFFVASRGSSVMTSYKNASVIVSGTPSSSVFSEYPFYLFAMNFKGSSSAPVERRFCFFFVGSYLDSSEVGTLNSLVHSFQTALSRNL